MWGDWYFARSLADAFERRDVRVLFDFVERGAVRKALQWARPRGQVDLVIRGKRPVQKSGHTPYFIWLISQPDTVSDEELWGAEHVFVASRPFADQLGARGISCSFLPQCTDFRRFGLDQGDPGLSSDVLFVGNRRVEAPRPVVDLALRAGMDLQVWGKGWDGVLPADIWKGVAIPNDQLGAYYGAANIVLNDHTPNMLLHGFASNRVYDVLACGTALLTEEMAGLPDVAETYCHQYVPGNFEGAVERARAMTAQDRASASRVVMADHTFDNRARVILDAIVQ